MRCCEDLKQHGDVTDGADKTDACLGWCVELSSNDNGTHSINYAKFEIYAASNATLPGLIAWRIRVLLM
jgi:hypothetical protein